jgi:hypothetical protein
MPLPCVVRSGFPPPSRTCVTSVAVEQYFRTFGRRVDVFRELSSPD